MAMFLESLQVGRSNFYFFRENHYIRFINELMNICRPKLEVG